MNRGDVVLAFYPFASGSGGKRRPGRFVQNDADIAQMAATILAQITTNLARAGEPAGIGPWGRPPRIGPAAGQTLDCGLVPGECRAETPVRRR